MKFGIRMQYNLMKLFTAIIFGLICFSNLAIAGSYQGNVRSIFAYDGKVFVYVHQGSFDDSNTCTSNENSMVFWFIPDSFYYEAIMSIVLTAKATNKLVWVGGSGSCIDGPFGKSEQLNSIDLKG